MQLVRAASILALFGSVALADDARPDTAPVEEAKPAAAPATPRAPKIPLRVVRVLPDTHQALLFDKTRGTHVLVDEGTSVDGFTVTDIDEDEVTLTGASGEVVLAAPDPSWRHRETKDAGPKAEPVRSAPLPEDPYGDAPVASLEAPAEPAPAPVRPSEAPVAIATPAVVTVAAPTVVAAVPPPPPAVAPVATDAAAPTHLSRAEVGGALSDFAKLAASIHAAFTPAGVRVESVVETSLFARAGLRAGDIIATVDGQPLHSLDDAATLYARAATARNMTAQVVRGGKPLTLRVAIQ